MNLDTIIIDTQLSNLHSVINLCKKFQISYATSNEVKDLKNAKSIILPGVGSYKEAMKNLQKLDMISRIKDFLSFWKSSFGNLPWNAASYGRE